MWIQNVEELCLGDVSWLPNLAICTHRLNTSLCPRLETVNTTITTVGPVQFPLFQDLDKGEEVEEGELAGWRRRG